MSEKWFDFFFIVIIYFITLILTHILMDDRLMPGTARVRILQPCSQVQDV